MFKFSYLFFVGFAATTIPLTITTDDDQEYKVAFEPPAESTWCAVGSQENVANKMMGLKGFVVDLAGNQATLILEGKDKMGGPYYDQAETKAPNVTDVKYDSATKQVTAILKADAKNVAYACGNSTGDFPPKKTKHTHAGFENLSEATKNNSGANSGIAVSVMMIFATLL